MVLIRPAEPVAGRSEEEKGCESVSAKLFQCTVVGRRASDGRLPGGGRTRDPDKHATKQIDRTSATMIRSRNSGLKRLTRARTANANPQRRSTSLSRAERKPKGTPSAYRTHAHAHPPSRRQIRARLTKEQGQPALLLIPEVDRAVPQEERGHGDDKGV
jgi:hypothetical protein